MQTSDDLFSVADEQESAHDGTNRGWILSLGDLLTLLLCFFVSAIAAGYHKSSSNLSVTTDNDTGFRQPVESEQARTGTGTSIAPFEVVATEERLGPESFVGSTVLRLEPSAAARLRSNIESVRMVVGITVSSCGGGQESQPQRSWFEALRRGLEVRRQLLDAGVAANRIRLQVGMRCGSEGEGPADTAGSVIVKFAERVSNG